MKSSYSILFGLLALMLNASPLRAETMQAYFADFVVPATLSDLSSNSAAVTIPPAYSTCASSPPNVVFSVGFTSGLAYRNDVLYGLEWQGTVISLYTFPLGGTPGACAIGARVSVGTAVGSENLESLAYCAVDDSFYSVDFDFPSHVGQLVRINPITGVGTLIGQPMTFNVRINGMLCDSSGQLWAVTSGFGGMSGRNPELLTVNRSTGVETLVGELGVAANAVESLAVDRDRPGSFFAAGSALYQVNPTTGAATLVGGAYDKVWSMAGRPIAVVSDVLFMNGFEGP